ncbi:MAG: glycosyltransferase, partial [Verrucomicrobiota bacterium]
DFLARVAVFCVPARFIEPKGLYALEAIASGVPVVAPDRGAFPEILPASSSTLFEAENVTALEQALSQQLAKGARTDGPDWVAQHGSKTAMAQATARVFENSMERR